MTLVSVVTPTIPGREDRLIERCMTSVLHQKWRGIVEHVIVSDRNSDLADAMTKLDKAIDRPVRFVEINEAWRNPISEASIGAVPWAVGCLLALGEFVAFCGDDDELLPHHVARHIQAMRTAEALWSVSRVDFHVDGQPWTIIGDETYELGHLDAIGIMCHVDALRIANWRANGENAADHRLVSDWRAAGLRGVFLDEVTAIHHDGWAAGRTGQP